MTPTPRDPQHVIVLGAGPGGLTCAHELARTGYRVTVVDRESFIGGLSRTIERDGFRFDLGGHRWFTKNPALDAWFRNLMRGRLVTVERTSRILFGGKWFDFPITVGNVLRTAGVVTSAACLVDWGRTRVAGLFGGGRPVTMRDAFRSQFGDRLYDMFFRRYSEKVWGRPCSEMSADWVSQRSKGLSIWTALSNALLRPRAKAQSLIETFLYPRRGYSDICERLREDILSEPENRVILGANVERVDVSDPLRPKVRWRVGGAVVEEAADYVVSTVALPALVGKLVHPRPPESVVASAASLEFRSVVCVNLMLDMPRLTSDTWVYCHDEGLGFARFHEPKNWSPDMVPDASKTSVVLEYFCSEGDAVWSMSESDLVARSVRELASLGLLTKERVIGGFAVKAREAYPVYSLGYADRLQSMKDYVASLPRVAIVGRGGTFRYNNADHSIEMGLLTAQMIRGEVGKEEILRVNTSIEYGEKNLVPAATGS